LGELAGQFQVQLTSRTAVIRWLKQGFTLVQEHGGFFPADLRLFLSIFKCFSYNTVFNSFFEEKSNVVKLG
jgi:hypothetical protein